MIIKIIGWFWLIYGILLVIKPELLQKHLQKKALRKLKKYLFGLAVFLGILFFTAASKLQGFLAMTLLILGIIAILKGLFLLNSKLSEKFIIWVKNRPLSFFRYWALFYIALGLILIYK